MAVIGTLTTILRGDTKPLERALRGAEKHAAEVGVRLNKATSVAPSTAGIKQAEAKMRELANAANRTVDEIEKLKASGAAAETLKPLNTQLLATRREMNALGQDLKEAKGRFAEANAGAEKLRMTLSRIGAVAGAALVAGVTAATREFKKLGDQAETFENLRNATGLTIDQLGELQFLANENGWSFEALTKSTGRLAMQLTAIEDGSGRAGEAARRLGVDVRGANGELLPMSVIWPKIIDALRQVPNETERAALAAQLFGKSYQELMPFLSAGTAEVSAQVEGARQLGAVYSESLHQIGAQSDVVFDSLSTALAGAKNSLMQAVAPLLLVALNSATRIAEAFSKWSLNLTPAKVGFAAMLATSVALIPVVIKAVTLFIELKKAITVAGGVMAILTGNWAAIVAGIGAVAGLSLLAGKMASNEVAAMQKAVERAEARPRIGKDLSSISREIGDALPDVSVGGAATGPSSGSVAAAGGMELGQIQLLVTQIRDMMLRREQMTRAQMYAGSWG